LKNHSQKTGLVEGLKVKALSSNSSIAKTNKQTNKNKKRGTLLLEVWLKWE
jgi:hypothetical protein